MKKFDVIVIGTGAGNIVSDAALDAGLEVAVVEKHLFGGTCLNRGCIPTKVMVSAANLVRDVKNGSHIAVDSENVRINWPKLKERVFFKTSENEGIADEYRAEDNCTVYEGVATFVEEKILELRLNDGSEAFLITADKIIVATGTKTRVDLVPGLEEAGYVTSESFFSSAFPDEPYEDIVILGGGAIATEFAHVFQAAGSKVKVVQRNVRLLPQEDSDISQAILEQLQLADIEVYLNTVLERVETDGAIKRLTLLDRSTGEREIVETKTIFLATGVAPHGELHPEVGGIKLDANGWIMTNEFLETTSSGVYALGDCKTGPQLRHRANYEAEILAHNLFAEREAGWEPRWARYDRIPFVTYTYPEVAHVGLTEQGARELGHELKIGMHYYSQTAKGYGLGFDPDAPNDGFVKMVVDRDSEQILGIHIIGPQASVLLQPYVFLLSAGTVPLKMINEHIASETTAEYRRSLTSTYLDPASVRLQDEAMVPHPALSEVAAWTTAYLEDA